MIAFAIFRKNSWPEGFFPFIGPWKWIGRRRKKKLGEKWKAFDLGQFSFWLEKRDHFPSRPVAFQKIFRSLKKKKSYIKHGNLEKGKEELWTASETHPKPRLEVLFTEKCLIISRLYYSWNPVLNRGGKSIIEEYLHFPHGKFDTRFTRPSL